MTGQEELTLLSGGFPCQSFSAIGRRKGFKDARYLWPEMCRVINELRPHFVLGENVANFVNMGLQKTISDLGQAGYAVWTFVFPACAVGAWHERKRTFIVGVDVSHSPCVRCGDAVKPGKAGNIPKGRVPAQECERAALGGGPDGGGFSAGQGSGGRRPPAQSGMGGMADGVPAEMDGNLLWNVEPPGIPRLCHDVKDRAKRLKALGNAVVPAQVYPILKCIADIETGKCESWCGAGDAAGSGEKKDAGREQD